MNETQCLTIAIIVVILFIIVTLTIYHHLNQMEKEHKQWKADSNYDAKKLDEAFDELERKLHEKGRFNDE